MGISVVVPCFNGADFLRQHLESLLQQSLQPTEIILVDNKSTDDSVRIAKQFLPRMPNLRIIHATDRKGAGYARNQGALAAKGDLILFCDADDIANEHWVAKMCESLEESDFVASKLDYSLLNQYEVAGPQSERLQAVHPRFLPHAGGCGLGIRAEVHRKVSGFSEEVIFLEDMDYCFKVQAAGYPLVLSKEAVIHKRDRDNTFAEQFNQTRRWAEYFPYICDKYKNLHGFNRGSVTDAVWAYVLTVLRAFRNLALGKFQNSYTELGWRYGYIVGSLRYGVFPFYDNRPGG